MLKCAGEWNNCISRLNTSSSVSNVLIDEVAFRLDLYLFYLLGKSFCSLPHFIYHMRFLLCAATFCLFVFLPLQPIVVIFSQPGGGLLASSFSRFLDHTQRRATFGWTPPDEWSIRRRDRYLTTHNTYNRKTSMPPVGFEPTISAGERPQTYALDRAATGTGTYFLIVCLEMQHKIQLSHYKSTPSCCELGFCKPEI